MTQIKLLKAESRNGIVYFDGEGRIYEWNILLRRYLATDKFVYFEYYNIPLCLLSPEYVPSGGYDPIEDEVTYEVYDDE